MNKLLNTQNQSQRSNIPIVTSLTQGSIDYMEIDEEHGIKEIYDIDNYKDYQTQLSKNTLITTIKNLTEPEYRSYLEVIPTSC